MPQCGQGRLRFMLYQIVSFLLDVVAGLLGGACLLRIYMQWQRVPFNNPVGRLVFALSDWMVLPLRRLVPPLGRCDGASRLAALLGARTQSATPRPRGAKGPAWRGLPVLALFGLARMAIMGLIGLLIVYAVMSWVQAHSPISHVIARLCEPVLRPVRRIIPLVGGIDLSPLVLLVLLQVALMVLGHLQATVLR